MTTTLKSMEETIAALHAAKLDCKVMVGGAVLTPEYAEKIGADWYAKDESRVPILPRNSSASHKNRARAGASAPALLAFTVRIGYDPPAP